MAVAICSAAAGCRGDETVRAYGGEAQIWSLTELNGTPYKMRSTLSFPQAGKIAGDAPCNSYTAQMTVPYPWFEIGPIAATKRACQDLHSEATYFGALSEATLSEVVGKTLILSNPEGLSMVFTAAD